MLGCRPGKRGRCGGDIKSEYVLLDIAPRLRTGAVEDTEVGVASTARFVLGLLRPASNGVADASPLRCRFVALL